MISRRYLILLLMIVVGCSDQSEYSSTLKKIQATPTNFILCMTDDLGWGDPGYNGNQIIKTPNLDDMASSGLVFNRFYSSSPVCSPTRGSCLTGRHPYRYGIFSANTGHLPKEEITLAGILKENGYRTGHFGKWHLGTLTKSIKDSNRGGKDGGKHYAPPWEYGFEVCFSTEAKVPTYDPMLTPIGWQGNTDPNKEFGTYYWNEKGDIVTENLNGDDSRIIMNRAIPFIKESVEQNQSFFVVIWFHTPHLPVLADSVTKSLYYEFTDEEQNYYGCITAMDKQMGRLRTSLRELGVGENTMVWFTSDNGPEGPVQNENRPGSAGPFKGRKRSLYEGGVRVSGILEWPSFVNIGENTEVPASTLDYLPTILEVLNLDFPDQRPIDGISLLPVIFKNRTTRESPIGFESGKQVSFMNDRYKIYSNDKGESFELYDLLTDKGENYDIAMDHPEKVEELKEKLESWRESCRISLKGADYQNE